MFWKLFSAVRPKAVVKRPGCRPRLEALEDRLTPSVSVIAVYDYIYQYSTGGGVQDAIEVGKNDIIIQNGTNQYANIQGNGDKVVEIGPNQSITVVGNNTTVHDYYGLITVTGPGKVIINGKVYTH